MKSHLRWMTRRLRPLVIAMIIASIAIGFAATASACPTCKDGVAQNDPQREAMAAGYYYSILFMLSMPVIIITTFSACAYRAVKKAQRLQPRQPSSALASASPATC